MACRKDISSISIIGAAKDIFTLTEGIIEVPDNYDSILEYSYAQHKITMKKLHLSDTMLLAKENDVKTLTQQMEVCKRELGIKDNTIRELEGENAELKSINDDLKSELRLLKSTLQQVKLVTDRDCKKENTTDMDSNANLDGTEENIFSFDSDEISQKSSSTTTLVPVVKSRKSINITPLLCSKRKSRNVLDEDEIAPKMSKFDVRSEASQFMDDAGEDNTFVTPIREMITHMTSNWVEGGTIESSKHNLVKSKNFVAYCDVCQAFVIKGKNCMSCTKCHIHIHASCFIDAPAPCVPRPTLSQKTPKTRPTLLDFCPQNHPMVPYIIIHSVIAIEKQHIDTEGLYRIPGNGATIGKLLQAFKSSRAIPNLKNQTCETLTGCIKLFLRELREPLIPTTSCLEFMKAAKANNSEDLNFAICNLPSPNKDTLAYLCLHWKKVATRTPLNKMTIQSIATCLGPTIVGRVIRGHDLDIAKQEINDQNRVIEHLLRFSENYWSQILNGRLNNQEDFTTPRKNTHISILATPINRHRTMSQLNSFRH
uniref:Rac GTPase-activating protein 1 n=1 Tax=Rhabditophanes sp. KR3021 TaxID=114890 RepID=A0AC35TSV9_9BILA